MLDPRVRLLMLLSLSLAHAVASAREMPVLILSTLVISLAHRRYFLRGAKVIILTSAIIGVIAFLVWATDNGSSPANVIADYFRWVSLTVTSVVLSLSLNAMEISATLTYFRMPTKIALAVGVGLRFIPVILEEARRVRMFQRQRALPSEARTFGSNWLENSVSRKLSPFIVSALRRADLLIVSIAVQEIESRIRAYEFAPFRLQEWVVTTSITGLALAIIVI